MLENCVFPIRDVINLIIALHVRTLNMFLWPLFANIRPKIHTNTHTHTTEFELENYMFLYCVVHVFPSFPLQNIFFLFFLFLGKIIILFGSFICVKGHHKKFVCWFWHKTETLLLEHEHVIRNGYVFLSKDIIMRHIFWIFDAVGHFGTCLTRYFSLKRTRKSVFAIFCALIRYQKHEFTMNKPLISPIHWLHNLVSV